MDYENITQKENKRRISLIIREIYMESDMSASNVEDKLTKYFGQSPLKNGAAKKVWELVERTDFCPPYSKIAEEIKEVLKYEFNEGADYVLVFNDGKKITLECENLLKKNVFDSLYISNSGKAPTGKIEEYRYFIARCLSGKVGTLKTTVKEDIDEGSDVEDAFIRYLETATITHEVKELRFNPLTIYEHDGVISIPSKSMRKILERENLKVDFRKLRRILSKYIFGSTKVMYVADQTIRVWNFEVKKLPTTLTLVRVGDDYDEEK